MNPSYNQLGTYYDPANKAVYALVTLHKTDITDDTRQLDYDDQYLASDIFQWESRNNLPDNERKYLLESQTVYLFIRKVKESNGVTLPYIFAGTGHFTGWRNSPTKDKCLIFTIQMDEQPPEDIAADFAIPKEQ